MTEFLRPEGCTDQSAGILGEARGLLPEVLDCMHCGLCLEQCATYRESGAEDRSPRGRLFVMRAVDEGRLSAQEAAPSLSSCLQCRACEPVCPSKVNYHGILEQYFAKLPPQLAPPTSPVVWWLKTPARVRQLGRVGRWLRKSGVAKVLSAFPPQTMRQGLAALPQSARASRWSSQSHVPAQGRERARVSLMLGCLEREWFGPVLDNLVDVLKWQGVTVRMPRQPACCGAFAGHAGDAMTGRQQAQDMLQALQQDEDLDAILVSSAGCHAWLHGFDPAARVMEPMAFLATLGLEGELQAVAQTAALQEACHQRNVGDGFDATRELLQAIPELTLVADPEAELCCGAGGATFLREPEQAQALGQRKHQTLCQDNPDVLLSSNPGCRMQLQASQGGSAKPLAILHPIQMLWRAIKPQ
jgi:glycolate oxidase iron-sulfur subunit